MRIVNNKNIYRKSNIMKNTFLFFILTIISYSCCQNSKTENECNRKAEIENTDRMITYYLIGGDNAMKKWVDASPINPPQYTTDDLIESDKLLITKSGIIKEIEIGQWYKVDNYHIRTAGQGWKKIKIEYTNVFGKAEIEIFLPENCI